MINELLNVENIKQNIKKGNKLYTNVEIVKMVDEHNNNLSGLSKVKKLDSDKVVKKYGEIVKQAHLEFEKELKIMGLTKEEYYKLSTFEKSQLQLMLIQTEMLGKLVKLEAVELL